jgi:hypothetical protein
MSDDGFEGLVAADELGGRKASLQVAVELVRVVAEQDRADAAVGGGDEDRAERALPDREANGDVSAADAQSAGSHAE